MARGAPSQKNTAANTASTMPGSRGGTLKRGNPGNKGGGRKPAIWKAQCEAALREAKAIPVLKEIISGDIFERIGTDAKTGKPIYGETKNSDRLGAVKFLASYAHGEPAQSVALEGELVIRIVDEGKRHAHP